MNIIKIIVYNDIRGRQHEFSHHVRSCIIHKRSVWQCTFFHVLYFMLRFDNLRDARMSIGLPR